MPQNPRSNKLEVQRVIGWLVTSQPVEKTTFMEDRETGKAMESMRRRKRIEVRPLCAPRSSPGMASAVIELDEDVTICEIRPETREIYHVKIVPRLPDDIGREDNWLGYIGLGDFEVPDKTWSDWEDQAVRAHERSHTRYEESGELERELSGETLRARSQRTMEQAQRAAEARKRRHAEYGVVAYGVEEQIDDRAPRP